MKWGDWKAALADVGLLVNTTSLGMTGKPAMEIDLAALPREAAVADIVYNPLETELLRAAKARGHRTMACSCIRPCPPSPLGSALRPESLLSCAQS
jgi:shikimate 5-dehydrogenase